jgi:hypothetical protein
MRVMCSVITCLERQGSTIRSVGCQQMCSYILHRRLSLLCLEILPR